jgi:hypothetical protein
LHISWYLILFGIKQVKKLKMKFSAILLLALIGFAACQRNADLQKCVDDIQDSVGMIKSTAHDIQQHHYLQALHHIKQLVADVEDEHEVCANITI